MIEMLKQLIRRLLRRLFSQRRLPTIGALLRTDDTLLRFCKIVNWAIVVGAVLSVLFIWVGYGGPWWMFAVGIILLAVVIWLFRLGFDIVHHRVIRVVEVLGKNIEGRYREEGPCFLTPFLEDPVADVSLQKRQWRLFTKDDPEAKTQEMRNSKITISEAYALVQPILDNAGDVNPDFAHQMVYAYKDIPEVKGVGESAVQRVICDLSETTIRAICATYFLDEALSGGKIGFNILGRIRVAAKILTKQDDDIDIEKEGITAEELDVLKRRAEELTLEEAESIVHAAAHIRSIEGELATVHLEFSRVAFAITNFELSPTAATARDLLHTREKEAEAAEFVAKKRGIQLTGTLVHALAEMYGKEPEEIRKELADPDSEIRGPALELLREMMPQQMSLEGKALQHIKVDGAEAFLVELASLFGGTKVVASEKNSSSKKDPSKKEKEED